jgi:hypothetical protein
MDMNLRRSSALAVGLFLAAALAAAQDSPASRQPSAPPSRHLDLARLDETIRQAHAAADTVRDAGDLELAGRITAFARRAASLRERAGDRRQAPGGLDRDLGQLRRESRQLERDLAHSPRAQGDAAGNWAEVVRLVEGLRAGREERATSGTSPTPARPADREPTDREPLEPDRARDEARPAPQASADASLPSELERRVRVAQALTDQVLSEETQATAERVFEQAGRLSADYGSLAPEERTERAGALLAEARRVQRSLTGRLASRELVDAWNGIVETLTLMGGR